MKRTGWVFGVASLVAACGAAKHPVCYGDGSPACGAVRPGTTAVVIEHSEDVAHSNAVVKELLAHGPDAIIAKPLLAPGAAPPQMVDNPERPLVGDDDRPMPGNVKSKDDDDDSATQSAVAAMTAAAEAAKRADRVVKRSPR